MNTSSLSLPAHADDKYKKYVERIEQLENVRMIDAIPKELFVKNTTYSVVGFLASYGLYFGSIVGLAFSPHWLFSVLLLISAGLGGWGLHCIAHDCGHGSFSNSRKLNVIVGHLSLIPLLYPFHAWRHVHNMHHGATNNLEMDTDWRPVSRAIYDRMPARERLSYLFNRTVGFWAGTIQYWLKSAFRPSFFHRKAARNEIRRSVAFVILAGLIIFPTLWYFTGISGVVLYFLLPLLSTHIWFSITTLMHHTDVDVPFLEKENWTLNGSRILLTTDYIYPRWLLWLTHNISIHAAHHVAPTVPYYNLPKAQKALKEAFLSLIHI